MILDAHNAGIAAHRIRREIISGDPFGDTPPPLAITAEDDAP